MKTPYAMGLAAAAVIVTVAIEETRIASLKADNQKVVANAAPTAAASTVQAASQAVGEAPVKIRHPRTEATPPPTADESFAKTARKMWDNPAGKSMMNQGAKVAVQMQYQDFIDKLGLSKEEADYFKNLLGKQITDQQEIGMKLLGASPDERKTLTDEMTQRQKDSEAEIKKFLNNNEDVKAFEDYKNHLPERQQLDGIRSAMSGKGAPLDTETEAKLVDAMYRSRTESKALDLSGPKALGAMADGHLTENYEKSWDSQQEKLRAETSKFLTGAQMTAFQDYQKQLKEMQLMGLKMAEKMMSGKRDKAH